MLCQQKNPGKYRNNSCSEIPVTMICHIYLYWRICRRRRQVLFSLGYVATLYIRPKRIIYISYIYTSREISLPITNCSVAKLSLPCSVQIFKTIWQLKSMSWINEISRDLSSRCVSDGCPLLRFGGNVLYYNSTLVSLHLLITAICSWYHILRSTGKRYVQEQTRISTAKLISGWIMVFLSNFLEKRAWYIVVASRHANHSLFSTIE